MLNIFRHLFRHWATILAVVALLLVQASCDLALPGYTSDIVDVGIQQGGVDSALPDTVRAGTRREVDTAIGRACADSGVAVLIVTRGCYELCRERLDELKLSGARPLVNVISDSKKPSGGSDSIMRLINEAIGIKF